MDPKHEQLLKNIEERIKTVGETQQYVRAMIYGKPGSGKTFFGGSAYEVPDAREVILGNADRKGSGEACIKVNFPNVKNFYLDQPKDLNDLYFYCRHKEGVGTVILDHLNGIQDMFLRKLIKDNYVKNPSKRDPDIAWLEDYGKNTNQMKKLLDSFMNLNMNVIFIVHTDTDKDQVTGQIFNGPALTPKLQVYACGLTGLIGYLYTKEEEGKTVRYMLTQPTSSYIAKSHYEELIPRVVRNPRFSKFYQAIVGGQPIEQ